ncbi:MAG: hypothetical protein Q9201_003647 [Fulgogasparrea decipioides]
MVLEMHLFSSLHILHHIFLFLTFHPALIFTLPPPSQPPSPLPSQNLTLPLPLNTPITNAAPKCHTHDPSWLASSLVLDHCASALKRFWQTQVAPTLRTGDWEFVAHTARPQFKPLQRVAVTPRKYEVGSCVLAIAMIDFYDDRVLDDRGYGPFYENDVSSFMAMWNAMHDIIYGCKGPGWVAVGECWLR